MENKKIRFHLFRYHLLPIDNVTPKLFDFGVLTVDELKEKKNVIFNSVLFSLPTSKNNSNPLKLEDQDGEFFLFKIAQKKSTKITQNFQVKSIDNEPYVYVVINNNPTIQKIAISENIEAFSNPEVVKNIIKKALKQELEKNGLNIEIEQLFNAISFWDFVDRNKEKLTYINFRFIKPNLANIAGSLPAALRTFSENVNSHDSNISIKAPDKGTLENIDKSNKQIEGLVNYSSEGGGNISIKTKNTRKRYNTKENPLTLEISETSIEGATDQIIKLYKGLVE